MRARLALMFATLPFACYLYACSSDDETPATDDAGVENDGSTSSSSGGPEPDGSTPRPDGSTPVVDAGDGSVPLPACGNPFTPDGGGTTPDGGFGLDASLATTVTTLNGFLDGPQWIDELGGRLVFSDYFTPDLRTVPATPGQSTQLRANTSSIGNAYAGGVIFSASSIQAGGPATILRTLPDGGTLPSIALPGVGSPNDLVINGQRIYFTDPCYQGCNADNERGVYQMLLDGGDLRPADAGTNDGRYDNGSPNGIALSPDNTKLYVSFTGEDGFDAPRVDVFTVGPNGNASRPQPFLATNKLAQLPDGLAVDQSGNVYVAEAEANGGPSGRVEVFSPTGVKWGSIAFPNRRVTGVAFGGADNTSLYITTQTEVLVFKNRCPGVR
jgi:gluconolactonase